MAVSLFYCTFAPKFFVSKMKTMYKVAEHCFALTIDDSAAVASQLSQYEPFRISTDEAGNPVFELEVVPQNVFPADTDYVEETSQDDDGSQISAGHIGGQPYFKFMFRGIVAARLIVTEDYRHGTVTLDGDELFGLNNSLMVMYALSTSDKLTALFHSSVIDYKNKGYMFLGKSGTGKSTHSRLWLKHIEGTELMNDDNPVVRFIDGQPWVFGSPWSGKTPCYKNIKAPLGAIVKLSQAPYNKIQPLRGVMAYAAVVPSISGKRWDSKLADGLHQTESLLASEVRMYHLECLPDEAAARLCVATVTKQD